MVSNGGFCTARITPARSGLSPLRHAASRIADSRMCSRLLIGSASMPSSASRPATDEAMRSLSAVASASVSAAGAANERSTDRGRPASEPGV